MPMGNIAQKLKQKPTFPVPNRWWLSSWPKKTLSASTAGKTADCLRMGCKALFVRLVATSYSIIYTPVPQSWTTAVYLLSNRAGSCARGSGGPASRDAWSGHSTSSLPASVAAFVSNLASSYLPSIHVSSCLPPARCSLSRYNAARPRWLLLREQRESHLDRSRQ